MTNQETFNLWMDKANKGKRGYQSLSCRRDGPTYQFEGQEGAVTSLAIGVWDDRKVYHCCSWNESTPLDTSKRFFAVVKDGEGLMIAVENEGLFSFGTKNSDDDKCKAAIFFQCGCISTFITAVNDPPMFLGSVHIRASTIRAK